MGMRENVYRLYFEERLERAILNEAKTVTGNKKLRMKDIVEWSTGRVKIVEGEKIYHLPELNINIAIKSS